jgi:hypothetical protein
VGLSYEGRGDEEETGPSCAANSFLRVLSFLRRTVVASCSWPEYNHARWIFGFHRRVNGIGLNTLKGGQACFVGHMGW